MWILFDIASIAFFLSLVCTPFVRDSAVRLGFFDRPDQSRKLHDHPIPRLGGVAVLLAYASSMVLVFFAPYRNLNLELGPALSGALRLAPAVVVIFTTGILDDIIGLKPWQKFTGQIIAAVLAYFGGFGIYAIRDTTLPVHFSLPLTVLWLVACANALNLIDGMDGLAAGIGFFAASTTLIAALAHQSIELALVTAPLAGALLGFLRYNFNPASIFLGDSGSLLIGFLLGCYGALWSHKSATLVGMTAPLMALAIPLLDVGIAVIRRFLRGQPIFSADRGHIHHRLLDQGMTPRRAALILYGVSGITAALSLLQDAGQHGFGGLIVLVFCGAAWVGVQHLGYAEFGAAGKALFARGLRRTISAHMQLQQLERALGREQKIEDLWDVIVSGSRDAGFTGVKACIGSRPFSSVPEPNRAGELWHIYIPLGEDNHITLYRDSSATIQPVLLTGFAEVVAQALAHRRDEALLNDTKKDAGERVMPARGASA